MLKTFEDFDGLEEIGIICSELNHLKKRIGNCDFSNPFNEFKRCDELFNYIKLYALKVRDESLANATTVYKCYFKFFAIFTNYHHCLKEKKYKESWNILQDCMDEGIIVGQFVELKDRKEIPEMIDLLLQYEKLYPYKVFTSSEYIISKSHCSICGKSMQSLDCSHRKGKLYWGEFALEIIDEIKELQAVCLVKHPEDKRCIIETQDDIKLTELEKFKKLDDFINLNINPLQNFEITTKIEQRRNLEIKK